MHRSLNKLPQDVRDDCRGERTISKSGLISIAKKKQARGMTTAYIAFKAKLQKGITKQISNLSPETPTSRRASST